MAANTIQERMQYIFAMQAAAKQILQAVETLNNLNTQYLGGGLSGTFLDADLASNTNTEHMVAVDVGTFTANFNTISAAITPTIQQNLAKCVGISLT